MGAGLSCLGPTTSGRIVIHRGGSSSLDNQGRSSRKSHVGGCIVIDGKRRFQMMYKSTSGGREFMYMYRKSPVVSKASIETARRNIATRYSLLLLTALACVWIQQHHLPNEIPVPITPSHPIQALASDLSSALTPLVSGIDLSANEDEADRIVRRVYERTYAKILPCSNDIDGKECIQQSIEYYKPSSSIDHNNVAAAKKPSFPWWFQTLLRDLPESGAFGPWHQMNTASPPIQFCTIAKVATTEWQKIFCILNNHRNNHLNCKIEQDLDDDDSYECWTEKCRHTTGEEGTVPLDAPRAVMLRDPLERLLSAYLNKCHNEYYRLAEHHCEPLEIFDKYYNESEVLDHIREDDQQMFAAYLDVMPLGWNLHFIPQAFSCDLYRNINQYSFIGNMDGNFMSDLNRMANQFGGPLPDILNDFFGYRDYTTMNSKHVNVGSSGGHSTRAPEKVAQFYTAQSLRRALEYVSIDYVVFGLQVPDWAKEMLRDDAA